MLKDQSEFSNSLLSSKIQDCCTYHHLHTCRELHPLNGEVRVPAIKTIQILRIFLLSILKAMVSLETSEVTKIYGDFDRPAMQDAKYF